MDRRWMHQQLDEYAALAVSYLDRRGGLYDADPPDAVASAAEMRRREPTVKEILRRLDSSLASFDFDTAGGPYDARNAAQRGLGIVEAMDTWAAKLAPDAPTLPADRLHPWVWDAARTLWETKHYRAAVSAGATSITAHTQTKVNRRDIVDADLMNQVFAEQPKTGQVYLRLPGDPEDKTVKSRNRALRSFAEGCFAGIRNHAAHEDGADWDEQYALEALAALSLLARWIDECNVRTGS